MAGVSVAAALPLSLRVVGRAARGATTLLASVEPCSPPDRLALTSRPRHHPGLSGWDDVLRGSIVGAAATWTNGDGDHDWGTSPHADEQRGGGRDGRPAFLVVNSARRSQAPPWRGRRGSRGAALLIAGPCPARYDHRRRDG